MNEEIKDFFVKMNKFRQRTLNLRKTIKSIKWEIHKLEREKEKIARDISNYKKVKMTDPKFEKLLAKDLKYMNCNDGIEEYNKTIREYESDIELLKEQESIYLNSIRAKNLFSVNYGDLKEKIPFDSSIDFEIENAKVIENLWKYTSDQISKETCLNEFMENGLLKYKVGIDCKPIFLKLDRKFNGVFTDFIQVRDGQLALKTEQISEINVVFDPERIVEIQKKAYNIKRNGEIEFISTRYRALLNAICSCLDFDFERQFGIEIEQKEEEQE